MSYSLTSAALRLMFDDHGALISFCCRGHEFLKQGMTAPLFTFQIRDLVGNPEMLNAAAFSDCAFLPGADGRSALLRFSAAQTFPGLSAEISVALEQTDSRWHFELTGLPQPFLLEWVEFPNALLQEVPGGQFLSNNAEGGLFRDLHLREKIFGKRARIDYPLCGIEPFYPGPCGLPFEAYYSPSGEGLYFGAHDPAHAPKALDVEVAAPDALRPWMQLFTGGGDRIVYDVVIAAFQGDWQDACEKYRAWMEAHDPVLPRKLAEDPSVPQWLKDSPVALTYPVKGRGYDSSTDLSPNEYFPYANALPVIRKFQEEWHSKILAILMHWEGTAPWSAPYVWPPFGGAALLKQFADGLHASGNLLGLYCSGTGWTQTSSNDPAYTQTAQFEREHLEHEMAAGPRREMYSAVCNGRRSVRIGYDLCAAREFTRRTIVEEAKKIAAGGADYIQLFDQNQGGRAPLCYARDHGHPAIPGAWHTEAMRKLQLQAAQAVSAIRPGALIGCENAAAEPFAGGCRLNDLRHQLPWSTTALPVPAYAYVMHEYCAGFTGNMVCLGFWADFQKTPDFQRYLLAAGFTEGAMLSVTLKDHGKIHWCWEWLWDAEGGEPAQEPLRLLIGNLNACRRGPAREFLTTGRMEKTPPIDCAQLPLTMKVATAVKSIPVVSGHIWSAAGRRALILANCTDVPQPVTVRFSSGDLPLTVPPLDALCKAL